MLRELNLMIKDGNFTHGAGIQRVFDPTGAGAGQVSYLICGSPANIHFFDPSTILHVFLLHCTAHGPPKLLNLVTLALGVSQS
jgi:hypothetical protein